VLFLVELVHVVFYSILRHTRRMIALFFRSDSPSKKGMDTAVASYLADESSLTNRMGRMCPSKAILSPVTDRRMITLGRNGKMKSSRRSAEKIFLRVKPLVRVDDRFFLSAFLPSCLHKSKLPALTARKALVKSSFPS
jgi:hypothetical protein